MERLQQAVAKMLPHLQIKLHSSEVLNEDETVFLFSSSEEIEPLYTMLNKPKIKPLQRIGAASINIDCIKF
jgi:hypothetical protein